MTFCDSLDLKLNCKNALFYFREVVHGSVLLPSNGFWKCYENDNTLDILAIY